MSLSFLLFLPKDQALLVADQFVVTFDGHLYELQDSCSLLLAQDVRSDPSFMLLLHIDPQSFLLIHTNNSTVNIQPSGQVCVTVDVNGWCVSASAASLEHNCTNIGNWLKLLCNRWRSTAAVLSHITVTMDWLWRRGRMLFTCPVRMDNLCHVICSLRCAASLWMDGYMVGLRHSLTYTCKCMDLHLQ